MLRKRLSLILDNVDEQCPADIAYVHSVYAPLSVSFFLSDADGSMFRNELEGEAGPATRQAGLEKHERCSRLAPWPQL